MTDQAIVRKIGFLLNVNQDGGPLPNLPEGNFAVVVTVNEAWFTVDVAGNVRGDPEAIEREALALGADNLIAGAAVGIARLALRSRLGE
jgi:hypothetical protein